MKKKAIILVAGMGTRLMPHTEHTHKSLTKINGTPILFNTLFCLSEIGITETVLVTGYLGKTIRSQVGNAFNGMQIKYASNPLYASTNTSFSLQKGLALVTDYDRLYVLEGDVFFEGALLDHLDENENKNVTMVEPYNALLDGTFVTLREDGFVTAWTHKSKREPGYTLDDKFKTINIHRFSADFVNKDLIPAVDKICLEQKGKEPLETVMHYIVDSDNDSIFALISDGDKWFEVDDENDLRIAEKLFKGYKYE